MARPESEKNYPGRMAAAFVQLWRSRDELSVKNIRKSHLQYFLILPVLLALVNMQNNFLKMPDKLLGLDSVRLMYISYCAGIVIMLLIGARRWSVVSRLMACVSVCAAAANIIIPSAAKLYCAMICWIGVGGLMAYAMYIFAFILNNTERLFDLLTAIFSHGVFMCLIGLGVSNFFLTDILPVVLISVVAFCVFLTGTENTDTHEKQHGKPPHPSIRLATLFFAVSFLIDSASSVLFSRIAGAYQLIDGLGIFAAILICLIIQVVFKQSVWHLWNLFFIVAFLAHLLTLSENPVIIQVAFFLHGVIYVGYVAIVYTIGGINKKYGSVSNFRKSLITLFGLLALAQAALGYVQDRWPEAVFLFTVIGCGVMLFTFLLLAPMFQRHLFTPEWMDDSHRADISPAGRRLQSLKEAGRPIPDGLFDDFIGRTKNLTKTERELFRCYVDGKGTQDILASMYISLSTLKTHNSHIFEKLSVSSRDELGLYIELIKRAGKYPEIGI